jgi:uncharacterized membrane protein
MKTLIIYAIAVVIFFAIDMVWLGVIAKNFYREKLGFILSSEVNWAAAIIFYMLYIAGILFFAVLPGMKDSNWTTALLNGAVLGLMCYATYDLTNMATIKQWPLIVVIADIIWGIILTGSVSVLTFLLAEKFRLIT